MTLSGIAFGPENDGAELMDAGASLCTRTESILGDSGLGFRV